MMKITRLKAEHIGCFSKKTFDFSDLTVIYGENRSGKSTLIYALYYALFGKHLNMTLSAPDLCQKGEKFGAATLYFSGEETSCQLWRSTLGTQAFSILSEDGISWNSSDQLDSLKPYVPIPADVASLTSFFREGELIYFLKDIPKYNKTLLQQILEMDDIFILQTRFKKAGSIAKEKRKNILDSFSPRIPTHLDLNNSRKEAQSLEKKLQETDQEIKRLSTVLGKSTDPQLLMILQMACDEIKLEMESIEKAKTALPPVQELIQRKEEIEKNLSQSNAVYPSTDDFQRQLGRLDQSIQGVKSDIQRLSDLEKQPSCHTCGQALSSERLLRLISERKAECEELETKRNSLSSEILAVQTTIKDQKTSQTALMAIQRQIAEIQHWDEKTGRLTSRLSQAKTELEKTKGSAIDHPEFEATSKKVESLQAVQADTQKKLFNLNLEIKQTEQALKDFEGQQEKIKVADRHTLLCEIAYQAMDLSVSELNRKLMDKIRTSLKEWADHFQYLSQFNIEITSRELTPIIQAKGYPFKLNQMSKSERIFLYMMLKLAIGDAMGHLGVFVLDDPADGLDLKRQEVLVHLLKEVRNKRQVIVTTNDERFADMFGQELRLNL